jgi:hypothetical protein
MRLVFLLSSWSTSFLLFQKLPGGGATDINDMITFNGAVPMLADILAVEVKPVLKSTMSKNGALLGPLMSSIV